MVFWLFRHVCVFGHERTDDDDDDDDSDDDNDDDDVEGY